MDFTQLLLILVGLAVAAGGVAMVLRGARQEQAGTGSGSGVPRPYVPLGIIAAGLILAYHSYSDYRSIDGVELAGLFLFGIAFVGALAVKLFVADRFDPNAAPLDGERSVTEPQSQKPGEKQDIGNSDTGGREG